MNRRAFTNPNVNRGVIKNNSIFAIVVRENGSVVNAQAFHYRRRINGELYTGEVNR